MSDSVGDLFRFDLTTVGYNFVLLAIAFVIALPVGWDRERATRAAGLRTFPLVAVASTAYVVIARSVFGDYEPEAHARVIAGLITGIGFLGGGAILKRGDRVRGTATAASIWSTAAIGAAVAHERLEVAVLVSAINFVALRLLQPFKRLAGTRDEPAGSDKLGEAAAGAVRE